MADFGRFLETYKRLIDKELEKYFNKIISDTQKKDELIADSLRHVKKISLAGGKRIRGALLLVAYFGAGGRDKKRIIKVAVAAELIHLFLLIHDDIIDKGEQRHGITTLHKLFLKKNKKNSSEEDLHFGNSVAIIVGDMLYSYAMKLVTDAGFDPKKTVDAVSCLLSFSGTTIIGQSQDISIQKKSKASEEQVLSMYQNKTARYTFESPLHVGMTLAGCREKKTFEAITKYAVPLGIAFQIQDDILGVFGDERKMGKSTASDIEEGKITILVVKAREFGTKKQQKDLDSILGKKNPSKKEIAIFQDIVKETGALEYSQNLSKRNFSNGKKQLENAILLKSSKDFLLGLVEYLENRSY